MNYKIKTGGFIMKDLDTMREFMREATKQAEERAIFNDTQKTMLGVLLSAYDVLQRRSEPNLSYEAYSNIIVNSNLGLALVPRPVWNAFVNYRDAIEEHNLITDEVV
jgi:hypothetical protein